jgi:preprotein translocase subunit SecE
MAMNREQRRYLQKQGQMDEEGNVIPQRREPKVLDDKKERDSFFEYLAGVRSELRKVTWPTKSETINYTIVVMVTFTFVTALVALLDFGFAKGVGELLKLGR